MHYVVAALNSDQSLSHCFEWTRCHVCFLMLSQAAARHHCSYLVQQHSAGFLEAGGEESWLSGLEHAPTKLRSLQTLNKLLAHRPWLITQQHIEVRHNTHSLTQSLTLLLCLVHSLSSYYNNNDNHLIHWISDLGFI